jgi:hypothetical protein
MYVTVFDDFDLVERLHRLDENGTQFKDYDLAWTDLPPVVSGLQSAYVDLSGAATVTWSFTPTVTAIAKGAAISNYLWDVDDGTITVGSTTTQNITVRFPGAATNEHRWVHLRATDDNGVSTDFHFQVFTVDRHEASPTNIQLDTGQINITSTLNEGYNATITVWDEEGANDWAITNVMDQTRVVIVGLDDYNGTQTPITSNIMMIGRTKTEVNNVVGTDDLGAIADATMQIEGFATQLGRLTAPRLPIIDEDSPSEWGEIADPTLSRTLTYIWFWHTTLLSLCSFDFDDFSGFISDEFRLEASGALDVANHEAETVNAWTMFAQAGEITVRRRASMLATADRAALTTVFDFTTQDVSDLSIDIQYGEQVGQIEAGAFVYDSTTDGEKYAYVGRAPVQGFGEGYETALLNRQILTADATQANAVSEFATRIANHLAVPCRLWMAFGGWFRLCISAIPSRLRQPIPREAAFMPILIIGN